MSCLITIILPVYGRSELLKAALSSVYSQTDPDWRLHIADDGSDVQTAQLISEQLTDPRISYARRDTNLGLFVNLNHANTEATTPWQLILCSDDELKPDAISALKTSIYENPGVRLILSSYESIDIDSQLRHDVNGEFYDRFAPHTHLFGPGELLRPLLRFGSINGNITGLLIHHSLFTDAGLWRSDWIQAADWEWLIRASTYTSVLIRREPIASVRVHDGQLSVSNQKTHRELLETLELLSELLQHPLLEHCPERYRWASHHAQFQLWNILKRCRGSGLRQTLRYLLAVQRSVGLLRTALALFRSIPQRLRIRGTDLPLLPPL